MRHDREIQRQNERDRENEIKKGRDRVVWWGKVLCGMVFNCLVTGSLLNSRV